MKYVPIRKIVLDRITERQLTQQEVADRAGMTQPQLSAWLGGKRQLRDDVLDRLLATLGLEVAAVNR